VAGCCRGPFSSQLMPTRWTGSSLRAPAAPSDTGGLVGDSDGGQAGGLALQERADPGACSCLVGTGPADHQDCPHHQIKPSTSNMHRAAQLCRSTSVRLSQSVTARRLMPACLASPVWVGPAALLHRLSDCQGSSFSGQTYPTASVTGVPSAVKPFSTAARTWNSAT